MLSGKILGAMAGFVAGLLFSFMLSGTLTRVLVVVGVTLAGFFAPTFYLYQKAYDRSARIRRELADSIDLLTISVESGLGFDAALQQVAHNTDGPLADELSRVLREMQIGSSRAEALRALAERTNLAELRSFVSAMVQADAFGIPIANVLRVQSSEMRVKRRQRAEEKAQQVPVKMTIPLIFCILPCPVPRRHGPRRHSHHGQLQGAYDEPRSPRQYAFLAGTTRGFALIALGGGRRAEPGRRRTLGGARHRLYLAGGHGGRAAADPASWSRSRPKRRSSE